MADMTGIYLFSMIAMRLTGVFSINPIFGRRGIPVLVKSGMILVLSLLVFTFTGKTAGMAAPSSMLIYGLLLLRELFVGFVLGFVFQIFFLIVQYVGTVIDFGMGLSLATAWDPQSNVSVTINSNVLYWFMIALFFTTDGHLVFLNMILQSGQIAPYGSFTIAPQIVGPVLELFKNSMDMAVRMAFPMLAIQLLTEVGVGVIMKMIPQIDVFVVNIQLKIGVGMLFLLLMASPYGEFIKGLLEQMLNQSAAMLNLMR